MAPLQHQHHFVMIPLMAPGHIIPMIDMAKLFAKRGGVNVTIIVTSLDAARFSGVVNRAAADGLPIQLHQIRFPCHEAGLPPGCESADTLPSYDMMKTFMEAVNLLQQPVEEILKGMDPFPSCIVCDKYVAWTADTCNKFGIPRIVFDGMNCFTQLLVHNLRLCKIHETVPPTESFIVPGFPKEYEIEFTKLQLPGEFNPGPHDWTDVRKLVRETESQAFGVVVNSFEELEKVHVDEFKRLKQGKVWCIGPLSLYNDNDSDMAQRGNQASIDSNHCLKWLDDKDSGSVIYACLGSLCRLSTAQFIELAMGLEESDCPFILVVKGGSNAYEIEKWISENGIEGRVKGRGLLIRGWAPQVLILSHKAVGGFLTHCGWNSTLEGICAGVPMVTWPMFAEQFFNEKLVVGILGTGVGVGAQAMVHLGEVEEKEAKVGRNAIREAVRRVMDGGEVARRAREIAELARRAVADGGSSCRNIEMMIEAVHEVVKQKKLVNR